MDRICVDGFPRSGNIFCQALLTNAFPQAWVTPFTHSARVLTKEHFVLIREPSISISSFMSVFKEPNKDSSERWWLRFHNVVLEKVSSERWIFFDDLVNKPEQTLNHIGEVIGLKPIKFDYATLNKNAAPEPYPLHLFDKAQELYENLKAKAQR